MMAARWPSFYPDRCLYKCDPSPDVDSWKFGRCRIIVPGGGLAEGQGGRSPERPPRYAGARHCCQPAPSPPSPGATRGELRKGGGGRKNAEKKKKFVISQYSNNKKKVYQVSSFTVNCYFYCFTWAVAHPPPFPPWAKSPSNVVTSDAVNVKRPHGARCSLTDERHRHT